MTADHAVNRPEGVAGGIETAWERVLAFSADRAGDGAELFTQIYSP